MFDLDIDFEFEMPEFGGLGGSEIPSGCGVAFVVGAVGIGIVSIVSAIAGNVGFLLAFVFFIATIFLLPKKKSSHKIERRIFSGITFIAFLACAIWGGVVFQRQAEIARIEREHQAAVEAEMEARRAAKNKKLGLYGRAKNWVFGE